MTGNKRNPTKKLTSNTKRKVKSKRSIEIKRDLSTIPINIENFTKPSLYSFFQGLKNVFNIKGTENALRKDLLRFKKYFKREKGASRYQNLRISKGSLIII
jgi:hypothetical protein